MQLISLSANKTPFKTINFNESGPSFIVAQQKNPEKEDSKNTYNGVGKSLTVAIIDFCLGTSSKNKVTKAFHKDLAGWCFTLTVKFDDEVVKISRHTDNTKAISYNEESMAISKFTDILKKKCLDIPPDTASLSWRSLLPFFLRPSKKSYLEYDNPLKEAQPYQKQINNAFLIGLDVLLVQKKQQLKKQLDAVKTAHTNLKKDPVLKKFFKGSEDSSLVLADLEEQISKLQSDLKTFDVADDYYKIKNETDCIKKKIDSIENQLVLHKNNIENIEKSLKITSDIKSHDIKKIYNEAQLVFQSGVKKQLDELTKFYSDLTLNRTRRFLEQKRYNYGEVERLEARSASLKRQFDQNLKFLNAHKALDVYTKISSKLASLEQEKEKISSFETLQHEYEQKKLELNQDLLKEAKKSATYLDEVKESIHEVMDYFRSLSKQFYPDALAGITVTNNDGVNQKRFNIDAKIQSDSSDGINSVKIFCYDMTLLMKSSTSKIDFIFHDSRLFSHIDETHCNELFRILKSEFTDSYGKQYIASINQNQLNSLSEELQQYVRTNMVIELTDDSDDGKLLGESVELEYD